MRHASPLTEQRRVCSSVGLAAWCGLLAPESRLKEAATWCQVAARITVAAATTGQLDTCTANTRQSGQCELQRKNYIHQYSMDIQYSISYMIL